MPSPVFVVAGDEWGLRRVFVGLRDPEQPLVFLDLREVECSDSVSVGNALSEALRRGLGSSLFGLGVGEEYAFAVFESFLPALEPITVAVVNADESPELALRLLESIRSPNLLVLHACEVIPSIAEAIVTSPIRRV